MKRNIIKILISILIFIIATIINTEIIYIKYALYIISYLIVGFSTIKEAIENILNGKLFEENFLMSIATVGALAIGEFSEAIAVMILYNIGEIFEHLGEQKSKKAISDLMNIRPDYANIKLEDGKIKKESPEKISVGDTIIVKPGEKVPLDGIVLEGNSLLDVSALTGESIPIKVSKNDNITSGCVNLNSILEIKVTKKFEESTVSKILKLVENAENKKAKAEGFITKFSKIYTPIVVVLAILIFIIGILTKTLSVYEWLYKALTFLVISCPCALVISVPLSFFCGIGKASKKGILIKGSSYMDVLSNVHTVVFDKTGTLTKGKFAVQDIAFENISKEEFLEYLAMAEHFSNHPIANLIKSLYKNEIDISRITNVQEVLGKGIKCLIDGKKMLVGNLSFMENENVKNIKYEEELDGINIFASFDDKYIGKIVISDEIKDDSIDTINKLKKLGIKTVILTGDKEKEANKIARKLGIDKVYAELLPNEKIEKIEEIIKYNEKNKLGKLAFVGDGINDSPALARADVGIAMGGLGSDAAIESSDVVIMTDEPSKILKAINISKKTIRIAKQNIIFAILIKILVLILSIIGITSMWMAVFADVGVTLIAILNSLR